uniref:Uncharacterized protein n=1 Tax=Setaria italica TaxID=4555 RepID=K4A488_SETIT
MCVRVQKISLSIPVNRMDGRRLLRLNSTTYLTKFADAFFCLVTRTLPNMWTY